MESGWKAYRRTYPYGQIPQSKRKGAVSKVAWKQEERRAELAEQQRNREILSSAPPETENNDVETEARYEYHLGDTVYIGASEYEILSFDDERVMLYDTEMPLFNKEFERSEFDRKVRENPMNEHLRVTVLPAAEKQIQAKISLKTILKPNRKQIMKMPFH